MATLAFLWQLGGSVAVVGPVVLPLWVVSGGLLIAAAVAQVRSSRRARRLGLPPTASLTIALVSVLVGFGVLGVWFFAIGDEYSVGPSGDDGCRVVVKENGFLDTFVTTYHATGWVTLAGQADHAMIYGRVILDHSRF
ncbi:hypothetical protein [Nakamurella leprariae]|uniref:Uncharacterized protein n=1 Tax=Nakamurella leprariae TaxID=2803911 RepID=A0A938YBV1_9ACTN|nr:hypothetical protein [Nakamurella leprariae]MBM9469635.1 hypothetical protein [Nakamurella leprariae]